jgi:hypothetical protein
LMVAAVAGGVLVGWCRGKPGIAAGLGLMAWACWKGGISKAEAGRGAVLDGMGGEATATKPPAPRGEAARGTIASGSWLLNLEPVPSVVIDDPQQTAEWLSDKPLGQGGTGTLGAFGEVPYGVVELADEAWLNEGAEIPDSVELPEVDESEGVVFRVAGSPLPAGNGPGLGNEP